MMPSDPYLIEGPATISFSGGRSSGYMLKRIIDAHGGTLPDDVVPVFANTGREMPETLDFVQRCSEEWGCSIVWVEYDWDEPHRTRVVNHNSAARSGEPFAALIGRKGFLPNPTIRFCTDVLKVSRIGSYARHWLGWVAWSEVIGIRADEPARAHRIKTCDAKARGRRLLGPMIDAKVTARDVGEWWQKQPFDLVLPNVNGRTPYGNCDLCFLKGAATIFGIMRDRPDLAQWWIDQEARPIKLTNPGGGRLDPDSAAFATFRSDRPKYADILRLVQSQGDLFDAPQGWDWSADDCACTD